MFSYLGPQGNVDGSSRIVTGVKYFIAVPVPGFRIKVLRSDPLTMIKCHNGVGLYRDDGMETVIGPWYGGGSCDHQPGLIWIRQEGLRVILIRELARTSLMNILVVTSQDGDKDPSVIHTAVHQMGRHARHKDALQKCPDIPSP